MSDAEIDAAAKRLAIGHYIRVSDAEHYLRLGLSEDTIATCAAMARSQGQLVYVLCSMALSSQRAVGRGEHTATFNDPGGTVDEFASPEPHVGTVRRSRRLSCLGAV